LLGGWFLSIGWLLGWAFIRRISVRCCGAADRYRRNWRSEFGGPYATAPNALMSLPDLSITIRVLDDAAVEALALDRESWAALWQHVVHEISDEPDPAESHDPDEFSGDAA
jgi:hypothetical protein